MDKDYIEREIEKIKAEADDDEAAHSKEDSLREYFISHLAERTDEIGDLAKLVLSTKEIRFGRWCS